MNTPRDINLSEDALCAWLNSQEIIFQDIEILNNYEALILFSSQAQMDLARNVLEYVVKEYHGQGICHAEFKRRHFCY